MIKNLIALLITLGCLFYASTLTKPQAYGEAKEEGNKLESPADEMFLAARAYPDAAINLDAYQKAIQQAHVQMLAQQALRGALNTEWVTQGPFNIGARVNTIAVHPKDEKIMYLGFSRGGVFKTIDGGKNWVPIFDNQPYLSIGHIVIDEKNPNTVYVGTGDPNIGYYSAIGDGIWKSTDAGKTWANIGLGAQSIISKIIIDPLNSNTLYAATMGIPFKKDNKRGLYKSTDGGATWQQKLFVSDSTGVTDMEVNPQNPNIIYASTWDRIRNNNTNIVSGFGSGVYKSNDGGNSWAKQGNGLPTGSFSRVGITMYHNNPNILYAIFVSSQTLNHEGVYYTDNGGADWEKLEDDEDADLDANALGGFGWYFTKLVINPNDPSDIAVLGVDLWRSKDKGKTWKLGAPVWWSYEVHADKHDFVYTPSGKMILATDGGAYASTDGGFNWEDIENIPCTQFYRVEHNPHNPEFYYGGAQDNGTTGGNKSIATWERLFGGDGFQPRFDKKRENIIFYETQNADITAVINGNFQAVLSPEIYAEKVHWDAPYFLSSHEDGIIYFGGQRVWKGTYDTQSDDFVVSWYSISPNLTDNNNQPGATNTITTVEESPLQKELLYAGTADANVWRKAPTDADWVNISQGLPERYVTKVLPSSAFQNTIYVTLSGYRENEKTSHIWRSDNQGQNWRSIAGDIPNAAVNDILVLENNKDSVLFVATDVGVYYSKNSGKNWLRLGNNMPLIPVFDLTYNDKKNQLVAGTHARSIMTFDLINIGVDTKTIIKTNDLWAENKVKLYPTVISNMFNIFSESIDIQDITIFNQAGQVVFQQAVNQLNAQAEVPNLSTGIYYVNVQLSNKQRLVKKIVKIM